ncbi:MAG TPA: quinone-dependent dihydroorotate dehydrogenase [Solirubrobacteraceae bacterium]|nr:quinone-dependent dihydroorotate dehydrogenase [Solirubrobacteraceae bacterium]
MLGLLPPEAAHELALRALQVAGGAPRALGMLDDRLGAHDPRLRVRALGLTFPSPLGLAGGLDKRLVAFRTLAALGFGFVEVGTVTALAQAGNARPRLHRLPADRALINSMGFPNPGADRAARRLSRDRGARAGEDRYGSRTGDQPGAGAWRVPVAVNIGRSRAATDVHADYRASARRLAHLADLLVLNVSSPNTTGLRDMQALDSLGELVAAVRSELASLAAPPPLLVKISPDLPDEQIGAIGRSAGELGIDGIVAVNTTTARTGLAGSPSLAGRPGGLSGPPLRARALEVLRLLRAAADERVVLVSVGGLETATDALERIRAGATLVQAYTGFVYGGPLWPSRLNRELSALVRAAGAETIQELVATGA